MGKHLVTEMPQQPVTGGLYFVLSDGTIKVPGEEGVHVFGQSVYRVHLSGLAAGDPPLIVQVTDEQLNDAVGGFDNFLAAAKAGMIMADMPASTEDANIPYDNSYARHVEWLDAQLSKRVTCVFNADGTDIQYALQRSAAGSTLLMVSKLAQTLPAATDASLGAVKVGDGLSVTTDGRLSTASLYQAYTRLGAVRDGSSGLWELNGLTDLTDGDMLNVFLWSSYLLNFPADMSVMFSFAPLRTTFRAVTDHDWNMHEGGVVMTRMCIGSAIEVLSLTNPDGGSGGVLLVSDASDAFSGCSALVRIADCLDADNRATNVFANAFNGCSALREVRIGNLNSSLDFSSCPLITYDSVKFIVDNSRPSQSITITVHPTTWTYMSDPAAVIPEEIGGTYAQWRTMKSTAMTKRISFATK